MIMKREKGVGACVRAYIICGLSSYLRSFGCALFVFSFILFYFLLLLFIISFPPAPALSSLFLGRPCILRPALSYGTASPLGGLWSHVLPAILRCKCCYLLFKLGEKGESRKKIDDMLVLETRKTSELFIFFSLSHAVRL